MPTDDPASTATALLERVRAEPSPVDESIVRELLALLAGEDTTARRRAIDALRIVSARDPTRVLALDDAVESIRSTCSDPDASVRAGAVIVLVRLWRGDPDAVGDLAPVVEPLLADESALVRTKTLESLRSVGATDPEAVVPLVPALAPMLDDEGVRRQHAVAVCAQAATAAGGSVAPIADRLLECFSVGLAFEGGQTPRAVRRRGDSTMRSRFDAIHGEQERAHRFVRQAAGHAIVQLAVADPDRVASAADVVADHLDDPDGQVRAAAADTFAALASERPDVVRPHVEALADRLEGDGADFVGESALRALATLSADEPAPVVRHVAPHAGLLRNFLAHDDPPVRGGAATLLALVAADDPSVVEPAADRLHALVDDEIEYVRAAAMDALEALR